MCVLSHETNFPATPFGAAFQLSATLVFVVENKILTIEKGFNRPSLHIFLLTKHQQTFIMYTIFVKYSMNIKTEKAVYVG